MTKYTFNVSYNKIIMAESEEKALEILKDKLQHVSECIRAELISEKE